MLAGYAGRRIVLRDGLIVSDEPNLDRKTAPPPVPVAVGV
jgi:hypothetical protein